VSRLKSVVILLGILASAGLAKAQDFKGQYVGKDPCKLDLKGEYGDFSLRLDKTRNSELRSLDMGKMTIVMIIEYKEGTACGVIRDVVQIRHLGKRMHPEFRCFEPQAPTHVVVGAVVREYGNVKLLKATDAWRIDLKEQKFVETHNRVVCSADGWGGDDDGSDMVDEAKKYAAHGKPGQFGPESK
jgi:hypothetical protein